VWAAAENSIAAAQKRGDDTTECGAVIGGMENDGKTTYYVWIKAKNAGGTSAPGEAGSATMRVDTLHLDAYLRALTDNTPETPHTVNLITSTSINEIINTEDPSEVGVWARINTMVTNLKKYVTLDLSACSAKGNTVTGAAAPTLNKLNIVKNNAYIKGIVLPKTLTAIGSYAFYQCAFLSSVTIQGEVTDIDLYAFDGCTGLSEVTIPDRVTNIGNYAFNGCTGLTEVTIPASVTSIGYNAFADCANLIMVTFEAGSGISNFSTASFPGNLRDQYFSESGGGAGTYIRAAGETAWTNMASPPTGVTVTVQSVNSIQVSWDSVSWAESYKVYRASASTGGTYSVVGTETDSAYLDTGLSGNTTYYYQVSIVSTAGEGRRSTYRSATTEVPAVPANVSAVVLSSSSNIKLTWDSVTGASSYKVYRAADAGGTYDSIGTSTTTSYTDAADLSLDTTYYYKVSALNGDLEGSLSTYASETTLLYKAGDTGPAGGLVFYADAAGFAAGDVTCHYLEAAPADLPETYYQWGGYGCSCGTGTAIGMGAANTAALAAHNHGTLAWGSGLHPAARACADYECGDYRDWFLPIKEELNLMYTNLKVNGWGAFSDSHYWSSSESSSNYAYAWAQYFFNGSQESEGFKAIEYSVRAARAF
jgi:hypothetical protein